MNLRRLGGILLVGCASIVSGEERAAEYGYDVSFPVQHRVSNNYAWLPHNINKNLTVPWALAPMPIQILGNRQKVYFDHLQGCRDEIAPYGGLCDQCEHDRMLMNLRQPQSMQNYTEVGYKKIRAPSALTKLATEFWEKNRLNQVEEKWPRGNTFTNHWDSPSYLVSIEDKKLRGGGMGLRQQISDVAQVLLEDWTNEELSPTSMYGIRVYTDGAILLPHVDRLPLVVSAMINVAQDVDEDWPMEIYDRDGYARNITLQPGDMFMFESHSLIHGRPWPLKGRHYAMLFVHFEPTGHSLRHNANAPDGNVDRQYRQATQDGVGGQAADGGGNLPPYIQRQSHEEKHWRKENPNGWKIPESHRVARAAAAAGDFEKVKIEMDKADEEEELLKERDERGWQMLHDGVASGNSRVVEFLVDHGAEINTRTDGGLGSSPLHLAKKMHGALHPVVKYLTSQGALSIGPDEL